MVVEFAVAGALGGLVKSLIEGGHKLAMPKFEGGYLYIGFLGNIIIGAIVAYFLSKDMVYAFTSGVASNFVIEGIIERLKGRGTG